MVKYDGRSYTIYGRAYTAAAARCHWPPSMTVVVAGGPRSRKPEPCSSRIPPFRSSRARFKPYYQPSFTPGKEDWQGSGCVRFMLASNIILLARVLEAEPPGKVFGYARLRLGQVGEGDFQVTGEIKETEYVCIQDQLLGYITITFKVSETHAFAQPGGSNGHNAFMLQSKAAVPTPNHQAAPSILNDGFLF